MTLVAARMPMTFHVKFFSRQLYFVVLGLFVVQTSTEQYRTGVIDGNLEVLT